MLEGWFQSFLLRRNTTAAGSSDGGDTDVGPTTFRENSNLIMRVIMYVCCVS